MKIADIYKQNKRSLSFEIFPPKKDTELESIDETLEVLCELEPDFISVTFGAGGGSNCNRTIEIAKKIKHSYGVEPVVHLTSLHYDRKEIDEFAHVMEDEGIPVADEEPLDMAVDRNVLRRDFPQVLDEGMLQFQPVSAGAP
jgi:methylenetetrahydrofolate reductase (NADPH)